MNWSDKFKKSAYKSNYRPKKPRVPRCSGCGLRKKSPNHDMGEHHLARVKK